MRSSDYIWFDAYGNPHNMTVHESKKDKQAIVYDADGQPYTKSRARMGFDLSMKKVN